VRARELAEELGVPMPPECDRAYPDLGTIKHSLYERYRRTNEERVGAVQVPSIALLTPFTTGG